jgi:hypothetical protein
MATKVEEVVVGRDERDAQQIGPHSGELRCYVITSVHLGINRGASDGRRIGERIDVDTRHEQMALSRTQREVEGDHALRRPDAERVAQL